MNRVLILSSHHEHGEKPTYLTDDDFLSRLRRELGKDISVAHGVLPELIFAIDDTYTIYSPEFGDIADFDAVIIRKVGKYLELGIAAAHYLESKKVPFTDEYLLEAGNGKLACAMIRRLAGLTVPRTVCGPAEILLAENIVRFPCVVKADLGHAGQDNYLVENATDYRDIIETHSRDIMVTQDFIPNNGDFRILVLGGQAKLAILRQATSGHLNNTSQGGRARIVELDTLPHSMIAAAERAARIEHLQVAGVDMMVDKVTQIVSIIEVNRAPQIPSGTYVDEKITEYARFLRSFIRVPALRQPMVIGRVEEVRFRDIGDAPLLARIDTGAKTSAISANSHIGRDGKLYVEFLAGELAGKKAVFDDFSTVRVASSNGHVERRYKVKLRVRLAGYDFRTFFTLTDRTSQVYPVLIGRNILSRRFVVDVSEGNPDVEAEKRRSNRLQNGSTK